MLTPIVRWEGKRREIGHSFGVECPMSLFGRAFRLLSACRTERSRAGGVGQPSVHRRCTCGGTQRGDNPFLDPAGYLVAVMNGIDEVAWLACGGVGDAEIQQPAAAPTGDRTCEHGFARRDD